MRYDQTILLSDLDGTLFDRHMHVSARSIEAIRRYTQAGGLFGICSGRSRCNALRFLDGVVLNAPCVLCNGAVVSDLAAGRVLQATTLPAGPLRAPIEACIAGYPGLFAEAYYADETAVLRPENEVPRDLIERHGPCIFRTLDEIGTEGWLKALFYGDAAQMQHLHDRLLDTWHAPDWAEVFFTSVGSGGPNFLELVPKGADKGAALAVVRAQPAVQGRTLFAAGDYYNDVPMLEAADYGIAPANALDCAKKAARFVTVACDEDVIAHVIDEIIPSV